MAAAIKGEGKEKRGSKPLLKSLITAARMQFTAYG
jgi:hypothetical protein